MESCELCAKRGTCTRITGVIFGGCSVDFEPSDAQDRVMQIIREHGRPCVALTNTGLIGLTDAAGSVYAIIVWDGHEVVVDAHTAMSLDDWLG